MTTQQVNKLGLLTTAVSFLIGSLIFGIYYVTSGAEWLFLGYGFILLAALVNVIVLGKVLLEFYNDRKRNIGLLKTAGTMLLNIPFMLLYCWFALILLNTKRVTFVNTTPNTLTNLRVVGCDEGHLMERLEAGKSKTIWIGIDGDCSIFLEYQMNGQDKSEMVTGYVTFSMGDVQEHKIGAVQELPVGE